MEEELLFSSELVLPLVLFFDVRVKVTMNMTVEGTLISLGQFQWCLLHFQICEKPLGLAISAIHSTILLQVQPLGL